MMVRSFQQHTNTGAGTNKGQNPQRIPLREHPFGNSLGALV